MFLFAAMASIAFASCTTDEKVFDGIDESNEIRFTAAQYSAQSRAEHDAGADFTQDIKIWSWYNAANTEVIPGKVYTPGTGFESGLKYYWPVDGDGLDFVSVPTSMLEYLDGGAPVRDGANTTLTFSLDKDNDYHSDNLMTTQVVKNKTKADGNVALLFRHLFSKIKVNVSQVARTESGKNARWTVTLKSLKFIGLHDKGTVTIKDTWTAADGNNVDAENPSENCAWTSTEAEAANATDASRVWEIFSGTHVLYTDPTNKDDAADEGAVANYVYDEDYYMLPQLLTAGVQKVVISYDVTTDYLGNTTQPDTKVEHNDVEFNLSEAGVAQWYMNKIITYNIKINPTEPVNQITFTVNEELWGEGEGSEDI